MRLRYTSPALVDLDAILDYIVKYSPQGAAHVQARIQAVIDLVVLHPYATPHAIHRTRRVHR
jgi:plasmid stabilization system protein ParE